jgi:hypothetical protein
MWFQFAKGENLISIERQVFVSEWVDKEGNSFFRAPDHFASKLGRDGGCKVLVHPPYGVPDDLPDPNFQEQPQDNVDKSLALKQELSEEKSANSALRANWSAVAHENDQLKLQIHELTEKINELEARIDDEGIEDDKS